MLPLTTQPREESHVCVWGNTFHENDDKNFSHNFKLFMTCIASIYITYIQDYSQLYTYTYIHITMQYHSWDITCMTDYKKYNYTKLHLFVFLLREHHYSNYNLNCKQNNAVSVLLNMGRGEPCNYVNYYGSLLLLYETAYTLQKVK